MSLWGKIVVAEQNDQNFAVTTNGGKTWRFSTAPDGNVCFDMQNPDILYVPSAKSLDQGRTWKSFSIPILFKYETPQSISSTATALYLVVVRTNPWKIVILKSFNQGATWTVAADLGDRLGVIIGTEYVAADPSNPNVLYIAGDNGIFKSTDGGTKWVEKNNGLPPSDPIVLRFAIDPNNPAELIAVGYGIYLSSDAGNNWRQIDSTILQDAPDLRAVLFDPSNPKRIFAGTGRGVYQYLEP